METNEIFDVKEWIGEEWIIKVACQAIHQHYFALHGDISRALLSEDPSARIETIFTDGSVKLGGLIVADSLAQ